MPTRPNLLLCVPAHNEADIIAATLRDLIRTLYGAQFTWQIVVVDNASTDKTAEAAGRAGNSHIQVLSMPTKGKGAAIRAAGIVAKNIDADVFGFIDADLSADTKSITPFFEQIQSGAADIVIGSRLLNKKQAKRNAMRTLSSELFNWLREIILPVAVRDAQCGLKVMNRKGLDILLSCNEPSWFLDIEFLWRARKHKLRIKEIAIDWEEFRYPNRKPKLNMLRDGFLGILAIFRIRFR